MQTLSNETKAQVLELSQSNPSFAAVLLNCAVRERIGNETLIYRMKMNLKRDGYKVNDQEYIEGWKQIQKLGIGTIVASERDPMGVFKWEYNLADVGAAGFADPSIIKNKRDEILKARSEKNPTETKPVDSSKEAPAPTFVPKKTRGRKKGFKLNKQVKIPANKPEANTEVHHADKVVYIPIRKGKGVEIVIPSDLNVAEADSIAEALMYYAKRA